MHLVFGLEPWTGMVRKSHENIISIRGARVHNLKNIDVDIPRNKLVVITGISGSGKSSLAFDTIYAEGQRRYIESLSAYARQFLGVMDKPDVDKIEGISPAISISQRSVTRNPRSTLGTITEIYDYLRLLFSRVGKAYCPNCNLLISRQTASQIVEKILNFPSRSHILILAPVIRGKKGEHKGTLEEIKNQGFLRIRLNGIVYHIEETLTKEFNRYKRYDIDVVVDRIELEEEKDMNDKIRISDSVELALKIGKGLLTVQIAGNGNGEDTSQKDKGKEHLFSEHFACKKCGFSMPEIEPRSFSFNSPYGACAECTGIGSKLEVDPKLVVPNPNLSLAQGAIEPWMRASHRVGRQGWYWWKLSELASRHHFSMDTPVGKLSKKVIDLVLVGEGEGEDRFEGVIPNLERRYHETDSEYTRGEIEKYMIVKDCPVCHGKRLKKEFLSVKVSGKSIDEVSALDIEETQVFFNEILSSSQRKQRKQRGSETPMALSPQDLTIARPIVKEILNRLGFLIEVGLGYLTVDRSSVTLSGGEGQRIQLATQIGSKLVGVLYILDEPSIGLHPRDQERLIKTMKSLRDLGNTVLVVEHDPQTIKAADWIVDIGPRAGKHGGEVVFSGHPESLKKSKTLTAEYITGRRKISFPASSSGGGWKGSGAKPTRSYALNIKDAEENNLKHIDVPIPLGRFVCVTGVSGSGKSTLVNDILARSLLKRFYRAKAQPGKHAKIEGIEHINKVVVVDQSPIGRTPRSNPATYTGLFTPIRELFSKTKEARVRAYMPGRFSFNVKGGRCEVCGGDGVKRVEMYFLPDVYVECEACHGKRYTKEALEIEYKGKNISEVLGMTVEDALGFFKVIPPIYQKLETLKNVGLGYVELGQPAPSLSGGEAQRVKLATELSRRDTGKTLYILDEPTTGLHPDDIRNLLGVLKALVDKGNTVLVIEHNLDVIQNADWIIDLGPEGGDEGGFIVAEGTPREIAKNKKSYTGHYLRM